jgi:predicted DNA-binding transcriptional regulator AlpA
MEKVDSPFFLPEELNARHRTSDSTRWRQEKAGRFPRRIKLAARKIAYRRAEVLEWERDPEGWAGRQAAPNGET